MQAFYIISRISGTLLFAKEFSDDHPQNEEALEPVLTPARAFTFSPLRNHNALLGNVSAPQLYWSLYLNMMDADVYEDTYYVTNDALVVFAYCPHSILAVGVFGVPMAHLSLVVGCLHKDELSDSKDVDALFQTSIYATDANDTLDESSINDTSRIESAVDDYRLVEHADDYVFHALALVRRLGTGFTTAFDKTLQKCSTNIKSRFMRFESVLPSILADWFGQYILRSIMLVMCPTGTAQLLVLKCHTHKDTMPSSNEPYFCQTELVAQEPATLAKATPRGEVPPIEQKSTNIVYFNTPILTRESPGYRYSIQKTPRRSKVVRKSTASTAQAYAEANTRQPNNYSYHVIKAYLETGLCSDPDILSKDFYCCLSDVITTMMTTEQILGGRIEDGCASLFINFSSIKYSLVVFWQDASRVLFALVLKDSSPNGCHIPFWFPFLLPPLAEL
ncbi:Hypothetical protein DHA2_151907 [Giardia duodenalis]|uniref:Uncharacterized protein n=1 Tax=Giardia intestinalis TaxID=5741 RepID=V6TAY8_GIAIN|nr:Hypothetical protein DHA2_151907 [Giardia intestinalis]